MKTVKDLMEFLGQLDPELPVVIQKDPEGNGWSPWDGDVYTGLYLAESSYSGEVLHPLDVEDGEYTQETVDACENAVILCPLN